MQICVYGDFLLMKGDTVKIDVKKILTGEITKQDFQYEFPIEFNDSGYSFPDPVRVCGVIKNNGGYVPLEATCTVTANGVCARCLTPVSQVVETTFTRTVAASLETEDDNDEYLVAAEGKIDVGEPIKDELIMSLPARLLCSDDCKGLCHKCGKNLNLGRCDCPEKEPDPRWAALKNLIRN